MPILVRTLPTLPRSGDSESGFTLVEILVVIIIIGILAAIAIPIFLNQQRAARDYGTTADVRNLALNVETALIANPKAKEFDLYATETSTEGLEPEETEDMSLVWVGVGSSSRLEVSKTIGTQLIIHPASHEGDPVNNGNPSVRGGGYVIRGWNEDGQQYTSFETPQRYSSMRGGVQ